jgi:hypothetical protein
MIIVRTLRRVDPRIPLPTYTANHKINNSAMRWYPGLRR